MNWTSTNVPMWQVDCYNFRKVGTSFQLRDVTTDFHRSFVEYFAARYDLAVRMDGETAVFSKRLGQQ